MKFEINEGSLIGSNHGIYHQTQHLVQQKLHKTKHKY